MTKRIGESPTDDSHSWIFAQVVYIDNVTKYRGIPVSRYFLRRYIYYRRAFLNTAHPYHRLQSSVRGPLRSWL